MNKRVYMNSIIEPTYGCSNERIKHQYSEPDTKIESLRSHLNKKSSIRSTDVRTSQYENAVLVTIVVILSDSIKGCCGSHKLTTPYIDQNHVISHELSLNMVFYTYNQVRKLENCEESVDIIQCGFVFELCVQSILVGRGSYEGSFLS